MAPAERPSASCQDQKDDVSTLLTTAAWGQGKTASLETTLQDSAVIGMAPYLVWNDDYLLAGIGAAQKSASTP